MIFHGNTAHHILLNDTSQHTLADRWAYRLDPATTLALLKLNSVLGVTGFFNSQGTLRSIGIQCAFCHSTVDNSLAPGIGHRLDGWANQDLNVGAIVSLAPNLQPVASLLSTDVATVRKVLAAWGPGKFDAELLMDGKGFRPDGKTAATLIPPAFGLPGVNLHTWTGWDSVTYWNAFVGNLEMHGGRSSILGLTMPLNSPSQLQQASAASAILLTSPQVSCGNPKLDLNQCIAPDKSRSLSWQLQHRVG